MHVLKINNLFPIRDMVNEHCSFAWFMFTFSGRKHLEQICICIVFRDLLCGVQLKIKCKYVYKKCSWITLTENVKEHDIDKPLADHYALQATELIT